MCCRRRLMQSACLAASVLLLIFCLTVFYFKFAERASWDYVVEKEETAVHNVPEIDTRSLTGRTNDTQLKHEALKILLSSSAPVELGCMDLKNLDKDKVLVLGHRRKEKGFLTIGIPHTSQSEGIHHLKQTLENIQTTQGTSEQSQVTIVVFTSALNPNSKQEARDIISSFPEHVQSGLLQLIEAPKSCYPANITEQVKRSVEGAFLLTYVADNSDYYLELSDDVRASPNYVKSIRDFIWQQREVYWVTLEFGPGGFTGKLIRCGGRDIRQLIHLMVEFNQHKTIDEIYGSFRILNVQRKIFSHKPPLFQPW